MLYFLLLILSMLMDISIVGDSAFILSSLLNGCIAWQF